MSTALFSNPLVLVVGIIALILTTIWSLKIISEFMHFVFKLGILLFIFVAVLYALNSSSKSKQEQNKENPASASNIDTIKDYKPPLDTLNRLK